VQQYVAVRNPEPYILSLSVTIAVLHVPVGMMLVERSSMSDKLIYILEAMHAVASSVTVPIVIVFANIPFILSHCYQSLKLLLS
jgi:hypothetical protein